MTVVPLPTLPKRRKDARLAELFRDAKAQMAEGEHVQAWLAILASVEVAYPGAMPPELLALLDDLNACRDVLR